MMRLLNLFSRMRILGLAVIIYIIAAASPLWMAPGLNAPEPMGAYLNGKFPSQIPSGGSSGTAAYSVENAFPNLTFVDPVDMVELPNENAFLVVGLQGQVWKMANSPNTSTKTQILDLRPNTVVFNDGGMLGIVLHPEYGQEGSPNSEYLYIFYRYTPVRGTDFEDKEVNGYMRLSRFRLAKGANQIDPNSEYVMIQVFDRHDWHNGGDMFFDPDGFLYLAIGDEGGANDEYNVSQQIDKYLFSGVLKIDVDQRGGDISHPVRRQPQDAGTPPEGWPSSFTQGYYIPNDNPWVDTSGKYLEEFYAIGLRSPHRMSYDSVTGEIWVGDVGQGSREEISIVHKKDNLQWPYREGNINKAKPKPDVIIGNEKEPIFAYPRSFGRCVIGGYVYRGNRYPELKGKYIFADHEVYTVHTLEKDPNGGAPTVEFLCNVPQDGNGYKDGPSSFYIDSQEIIYILDVTTTNNDKGDILKVIRNENGIPDPPSKLSDLEVFTNMQTLETASGIIPYDVNTPLWSDRAAKKRWIALPNDGTHDISVEQITFDEEENWQFPPGTVMIKHFDLPIDENNPNKMVKLETRFLVFTINGDAYGVTYRWNEEGTEAYLIDISSEESRDIEITLKNGSKSIQTWDFPSRQQCMQCHNSEAGYALGLKTRQLNKSITYPSTGNTANQLETWNHLGMFHRDIGSPDKLPALANLMDENSSQEMRIRSYLDANCSYCHRPNGAEAAFDARSLIALYDQNIVNTFVGSRASDPNHYVIKPGSNSNSEIWLRDGSIGSERMPPVGRRLTDDAYLTALEAWIANLDANGPEDLTDGWYSLQVRHSDKYASVKDASSANQAQIVQLSSNDQNHQQWYIQSIGNQKYRINTGHSNMVLSLKTLSTNEGVDIVQEPWNGKQYQLWYFEDTNNGYYKIRNAYNNLELKVYNGQSSDGQKLVTALPSVNEAQQWKPVPIVGQDCFVETNGEVVMEAEHYFSKFAGLNRSWTSYDDGTASNGQAMEVNGNGLTTGNNNNGPVMNYKIKFTSPGTYNVWVRTAAQNGSSKNNSVHLGFDGACISCGGGAGVGDIDGKLEWTNEARGFQTNLTINVNTLGEHTFQVWMREDGVQIDKIVLKKSSGSPSNLGPNESIQGECGSSSCPNAGTPCDDGDSNTINDVEDGNCGCTGEQVFLSLNTSNLSFEKAEASQTINVTSNFDWTVNENLSWVSVSPNNGSGNGQVNITTQENTSTDARSGTVTFSSGEITEIVNVNQAGNQVSQGDCFTELNGEVVIEAENYFSKITGMTRDWTVYNSSQASEGKAMQVLGEKKSTSTNTTGPKMDYQINFSQTGTYYIWVRTASIGADPSNNSIHVGFDNQCISCGADGVGIGQNNANFTWSNKVGKSKELLVINVNQAGLHTFQVWMREDGVQIDKIYLTKSSNAIPSDIGSNESNQGDCNTGSCPSAGTPCNDNNANTINDVEDGNCGCAGEQIYISLNNSQVFFESAGGEQSVLVSSNYDWTVSENSNWLSISPSNGSGNGQVNITTQANSGSTTRSATVTFTSGGLSNIVNVNQSGSPTINGDCFIETNGQVSIEAENYFSKSDGSSRSWTVYSDGTASNGQAMEVNGAGLSTGKKTTGPVMNYKINFNTTGTYNVWLRTAAQNGSSKNNSVHLGFDGACLSCGGGSGIGNENANLTWTSEVRGFTTNLNVQVSSPGEHTIQVWMREDGVQIDKILLSQSESIPTNLGPFESNQGDCGTQNLGVSTSANLQNANLQRKAMEEETQHQVTALVYPNPLHHSRQFLTVDIKNSDLGEVELELYNAFDGKKIEYKKIKMKTVQQFIQFDLSNLPQGVYYLCIKGDAWMRTNKIMIK